MDVDPNYDPSEFLMSGIPSLRKVNETRAEHHEQENTDAGMKIHDDLAVSESEDEGAGMSQEGLQEEDDGLWF